MALLAALAPLDAAVAQWIETQRSCALDQLVFLVKDKPLFVLMALGGATLLLLCRRGCSREALHALLVVLIGGFLCELLKTGLERPRPSVLPQLMAGNSFPSGHITTAALIAGALGFLLLRKRRTWRITAFGLGGIGLLTGATIWQRLYLGHHWCTDVLGSLLLVGAWLCFTLPRPHIFTRAYRSIGVAAGLLGCYVFFYFLPSFRFALPSALSMLGAPIAVISFGESGPQPLLRGAWAERTSEPAGPITWITQGKASVDVSLPDHQAYILKMTMRPHVQSKAFACFPLDIAVNQQPAKALLLYRGWREYTLHLDPRWTTPGVNTITFQPGATFPANAADEHTVAFLHLRLFAEKE